MSVRRTITSRPCARLVCRHRPLAAPPAPRHLSVDVAASSPVEVPGGPALCCWHTLVSPQPCHCSPAGPREPAQWLGGLSFSLVLLCSPLLLSGLSCGTAQQPPPPCWWHPLSARGWPRPPWGPGCAGAGGRLAHGEAAWCPQGWQRWLVCPRCTGTRCPRPPVQVVWLLRGLPCPGSGGSGTTLAPAPPPPAPSLQWGPCSTNPAQQGGPGELCPASPSPFLALLELRDPTRVPPAPCGCPPPASPAPFLPLRLAAGSSPPSRLRWQAVRSCLPAWPRPSPPPSPAVLPAPGPWPAASG